GESFQAGSTQTVSWASANPNGLMQVDLYRDAAFFRTLGQAPMRQSNYAWFIDRRLGDGTGYRLKLTSLNFTGVEDFSDGAFTVSGSEPPANPLFGQALQSNGGFEQLLASWQTISGNPITLVSGGKGAPHSGARFLHGGLNATTHAIVRQEIDLL